MWRGDRARTDTHEIASQELSHVPLAGSDPRTLSHAGTCEPVAAARKKVHACRAILLASVFALWSMMFSLKIIVPMFSLKIIVPTNNLHNESELGRVVVTPRRQRHNMCFVHLGKTAGSAITCALSKEVQQSGFGNSGCTPTADDNNGPPNNNTSSSSMIAKAVIDRVHLRPAPVDDIRFDSFLVTLRHPIDRFVSWYYFVHPKYPPKKKQHHRRKCYNFEFFHCWPNFTAFTEIGLLEDADDEYVNLTQTNTTGTITTEQCKAWAWDAVWGIRHCWHNYWNFERTYGPLLQSGKQIFAIRTEHLGKDWAAIESILQQSDHEAGANIATETNIIFERRNSHGRKSPRLGRQGQENLCRALCREIQVYKKILSLASNLSTKDKDETLKELAETCPQETRDSHCSVQYDGELPDDYS